MTVSTESIRKAMHVARSPRDKGTILTIRVGVYDQGIIDVDGRPVNDEVGAVAVTVLTVQEFFRGIARGDYP